MKKIFSKELAVGISVIVAILILIFGIDYLKGINLFKPANFYVAEYDNVAGLDLSAPVTVDGYKVGQVREINFDYEKPGKIKVVLALNKNLRIPSDSHATIASTLLSGGYIDITLGQSKKFLEVGDNINTSTTPDLMSSVQNDIMPAVSQVIPRIDALLLNLNRLVSDPALSSSIQRLDGITNNIYLASGDLRTTMNRDIPLIMRNAGSASHHLDSITYNLALLSTQLKNLPVEPTMANVQQITENLQQFSNQLNSQEGTLGLLLKDPELYYKLNRVSADVDSLIIDIKKNPKRYINIKLL